MESRAGSTGAQRAKSPALAVKLLTTDRNTGLCIEQPVLLRHYSDNEKSIRFCLKCLQNSPFIFCRDTRDHVEAAGLLPGHY